MGFIVDVIDAPQQVNGQTARPTYEFYESTAASVWTVTHNLNRYPGVVITDNERNVMQATVSYPDRETVQISFSAPFAGIALLF